MSTSGWRSSSTFTPSGAATMQIIRVSRPPASLMRSSACAPDRQVGRRLVQEHGDDIARQGAKFVGLRRAVTQAAKAVRDERVLTYAERHGRHARSGGAMRLRRL